MFLGVCIQSLNLILDRFDRFRSLLPVEGELRQFAANLPRFAANHRATAIFRRKPISVTQASAKSLVGVVQVAVYVPISAEYAASFQTSFLRTQICWISLDQPLPF